MLIYIALPESLDGSTVANFLLKSVEEIDITKQASNLKKVIGYPLFFKSSNRFVNQLFFFQFLWCSIVIYIFKIFQAIDELKKLLLSDNDNVDVTTTCLKVLCFIFMDCVGKNPCRRTIARLEWPCWLNWLYQMNRYESHFLSPIRILLFSSE